MVKNGCGFVFVLKSGSQAKKMNAKNGPANATKKYRRIAATAGENLVSAVCMGGLFFV
jgi:hypothetical protein